MPYVRTNTIIRPVLMVVEEVQRPDRAPIDVTRCDKWLLITAHPGTDSPEAIQEIARRLRRHPDAVRQWVEAFIGRVGDIRPFATDPLRHLTPEQKSIPCLPHYIPAPIRAPWARYTA